MEEQSETHFCNVTFLTVGDVGPDGLVVERLLRCTKCKETYYCGEKQQKEHWRIHRLVCRRVEDEPVPQEKVQDEIRASRAPLAEVAAKLARHFNFNFNGTSNREIWQWGRLPGIPAQVLVNRAFWYLLDEMQRLCCDPDFSPTDVDENKVGKLTALCMMVLPRADLDSMQLLWAIPGMTTFLLNLDLLSLSMRAKKQQRVAPTQEEIEFQGLDPSFQNRPFFATTIGHILNATIFQNNLAGNVSFSYRNCPMAEAAARKIMQWYKDPYVRVSLPVNTPGAASGNRDRNDRTSLSLMSPRDYCFPNIMTELMKHVPFQPNNESNSRNNELVPGLTVADVYDVLTQEPKWHAGIRLLSEIVQQFLPTAASVPTAWRAMSIRDRVMAIHQVIVRFPSTDGPPACGSEEEDRDLRVLSGLLITVAMGVAMGRGAVGRLNYGVRDDQTWLSVVKLGSKERSDNGTTTCPWASSAKMFQKWYTHSYNVCGPVFSELIVQLAEKNPHIAPSFFHFEERVLEHILEFAMEPAF